MNLFCDDGINQLASAFDASINATKIHAREYVNAGGDVLSITVSHLSHHVVTFELA